MSEEALDAVSSCNPSDPFKLFELTSLCGVIENSPQRKMPLPPSHPVYSRLRATFESRRAPSCEAEMRFKVAIELLATLSSAQENVSSCSTLLNDVGPTIEEFAARHLRPNGHGFDDDVLGALLYAVLRLAPSLRLSAHDVLELVHGKLFCAISALSAAVQIFARRFPIVEMLQSPSWQDDAAFFVSAVVASYELSTARTFFEAIRGAAPTDKSMEDLDREYRVYLGVFNRAVMEVPLLDSIASVLGTWFNVLSEASDVQALRLLPYFQESLCRVLMLIGNMLCFTNEYSAQLRRFLSQRTGIVQHVSLPYLIFALDLLERGVFNAEERLDNHILPFLEVVKLLALLSYKVKICRPLLRQHPLLGGRLVQNEVLWNSSCRTEYFCLVVRLIINAELSDSTSQVLQQYSKLSDAEKSQISGRLTSKKEALYPIEVTCSTYVALQSIFCAPPTATHVPAAVVVDAASPAFDTPPVVGNEFLMHYESQREERFRRRSSRRNRCWQRDTQRHRYRALKDRRRGGKGKASALDDIDGGCEGDDSVTSGNDDEIPSAVPNVEQAVSTAEQESTAALAPEATASTSEPLVERKEPQPSWQLYSVPHGSHQVVSEAATPQVDLPPSRVEQPQLPESESSAEEEKAAEFEAEFPPPSIDLSKWRKAAPPGVPFQYLCALSRQIIRVPVIAPNGDVFDRETIMDFLKAHPRTHPLTAEELYPSELVIDQRLQREIEAVKRNYILL